MAAMTTTTTLPRAPIRPDPDADLVAKLRRQAPGAVETLVVRYGDLLYRLAVRMTGNEEDAQKIVQDALCAAVYRIDSFRHESTFASWLYRIAAIATSTARRRRRHACQHVSWDEMIAALVASLAGVTRAQSKRQAGVASRPIERDAGECVSRGTEG
jgi:RNA polymerase sigma-70 factor (ECF subfamily)